MRPAEVRVIRVGPERLAICQALRRRVFVDEQGVPAALEIDGLDAQALHFLALRDGVVVGTARLRLEGEVGRAERFAVSRAQRGGGVGRALLAAVEQAAVAAGAVVVELHAQLQAEAFYARAGYEARGASFLDAGIPHRAMRKRLRATCGRA